MIAVQGLTGSYTEKAALTICEAEPKDLIYFESFDQVFSAVDNGTAERAVVAFSNNRIGPIKRPSEILTGHDSMQDYWIDGGVTLPINHCLSTKRGVKFDSIREIITQSEAFRQCTVFTTKLDNGIRFTEAKDTALSAVEVANSGRVDFAAICSEEAACLNGLDIIRKGIQDDKNNFTRFVSFTRRDKAELRDDDPDNMIATLTLSDKVGSLQESLEVFTKAKIDLKSLKSREIPNTHSQIDMVLELKVGVLDGRMEKIIRELAKLGGQLSIIGSYKATRSEYDKELIEESANQTTATVEVNEEISNYKTLVHLLHHSKVV